jgi:hypothetical protein
MAESGLFGLRRVSKRLVPPRAKVRKRFRVLGEHRRLKQCFQVPRPRILTSQNATSGQCRGSLSWTLGGNPEKRH